ncbi:hypothetical protein MTO96_020572 [Rhipicephalus appendiculatus]
MPEPIPSTLPRTTSQATPPSTQQTTNDSRRNHGTYPQDCPQAYNHSSTPACRPDPARQLTGPGRLQAYVGRQGRRERKILLETQFASDA